MLDEAEGLRAVKAAMQKAREALEVVMLDDAEGQAEEAMRRARDALEAAMLDEGSTASSQAEATHRARDALEVAMLDEGPTALDKANAMKKARDAFEVAMLEELAEGPPTAAQAKAMQKARDALEAVMLDEELDSGHNSGTLRVAPRGSCTVDHPSALASLSTVASPTMKATTPPRTTSELLARLSHADHRIGILNAMVRDARQRISEQDSRSAQMKAEIHAGRQHAQSLGTEQLRLQQIIDDLEARRCKLEHKQRKLASDYDSHTMQKMHSVLDRNPGFFPVQAARLCTGRDVW